MKPETVLIFAAHPDDEVLGCGGTIARFANEGASIHIVFLADGVGARQQGTVLVDQEVLFVRRNAAQAAANILGVQTVTFGDFPDNRMDSLALLDIIQFVEYEINNKRPSIVLTHNASDLNIDHRLTHQAVVTACRSQPGSVVQTLLFFEVPSSTEWQLPASASVFAPNWFIDITAYLAIRSQALEAYSSELRAWPHSRSLKALEHLARWRGATVGVEAAEAFMLGRNIQVEKKNNASCFSDR